MADVTRDVMETSDWHNLYGESWSNVITPESFCHPAKFSRGLIRHIYQHLFDCGYLKRGDTVLDPFGGVALGAWPALRMGLHWVGVELEQKFVTLGQQNIDLWNARFGPHLPNWGSAVLLQGDSRRLVEVVGDPCRVRQGHGAGAVISSPPWEQCGANLGDVADTPGMRQEISERSHNRNAAYGTNPANLGNMPAGDPGDGHGVDGVIGSPPWVDAGVGGTKNVVNLNRQCVSKNRPDDVGPGQEAGNLRYGEHTPGQLAAMPPGPGPGQVADGLDGVIASPPWESVGNFDESVRKFDETAGSIASRKNAGIIEKSYGSSDGQLGQESGPTFWSAARLILQQCYHILKPGAVAVWVVKRFVRDKAIVEFSQQWADLCRSCGFELVHWHRAMLVEDGGTQLGLLGDDKRKVKKRYSFFRRLHAQKYPHLEIQWEDVLCTIKR